jgi:large conductance mechanosensitive channel
MWNEFKKFVMRGNVLDLAVGVIIGAAFSGIVTSLVNDILMPLIGILTGGIDFSSQAIQVGSATVKWGSFVQNIINFIIIAFVIFLIVRAANKLMEHPEQQPKPPSTKECPYCKSTINILATRCPECTSELDSGK